MPPTPAKPSAPAMPPSARWALASLSLFMLLPSLATSITNVSLPTLAQAFKATFQQVQWVVLSFLLVTTTLVVSAGRLGDVVGRRRLLMAGVTLFTAASAVAALAPNLWMLTAARSVQGMGAAAMLALTLAFVSQTVPKERTGSAMGMLGTMSAVGTALGPSLGGILIAAFGWQGIFVINVPLGVLALWLAQRVLPADAARTPSTPTFDPLGTVTLAITLGAYALSMTLGKGHFGLLNLALLGAAAVGLAAFIRVERRAASPLVHLAIFRDRKTSASLVMSALVSTVLMATLVVGPFYLSQSLLLSSGAVGLVMSLGPAVAAFTGAPAGRLVDRFGSQFMMTAGLVGMTVGCAALVFIPATLGVLGYLVSMVVLTASYAVFQAANNTGVMTDVPQDRRGAISGLLTLSRNLGLITGASAMGAVFVAASASGTGTGTGIAPQPASVAHGMHVTFAAATALIVASLVVSAWGRPRATTAAQHSA